MHTDKMPSANTIALNFPAYLSVLYLVASLVIYVLCPYNWPTQRPVLFYGLNAVYIAALAAGYLFGTKCPVCKKRGQWEQTKTDKLLAIVEVLTAVNFFMYLVYVFRSYGLASFDFADLAEQMAVGLKEPGVGYVLYQQRAQILEGSAVVGGSAYTILALLWGFAKNSVSALAVLYFKRLRPYAKIFTVAYWLLVMVFYISIGTNVQIFHIYLLLILPGVLEVFELWYRKQLTARRVVRLFACLCVGLVLVAAYFSWMQESRSVASGYQIDEYAIGGLTTNDTAETEPVPEEPTEPTEPVRESSPFARKMHNLWTMFSAYLSQGYYGMAQALTVDWTPMYGLGNSIFVVDMISSHITDIDQYTYPKKLEAFGWDSRVNWHSMYTWIANDVSFYGVPLVMAVIGLFFGMMFQDAIVNGNPFARASIFFYMLMILFIPCNNQIGQSSENLCAFLGLVFLWLLTGPALQKVVRKNED